MEIIKGCPTLNNFWDLRKHPEVFPKGYEELIKDNTNFLARLARRLSPRDVRVYYLEAMSFLFGEANEVVAATFGEIEPVKDGLGYAVYSRTVFGKSLAPKNWPMRVQFFVDKLGRRFDYEDSTSFMNSLKAADVEFGPNGISFPICWGGKPKAFSIGTVSLERDVAVKLQAVQSFPAENHTSGKEIAKVQGDSQQNQSALDWNPMR